MDEEEAYTTTSAHRKVLKLVENRGKRIKNCDTRFHQQRLPAWKPVLSPLNVFMIYFIVSVSFLPLGILVLVYSQRTQEVPPIRYDDVHHDNITFEIKEHLNPPVYFYYRLTKFYQNYRVYFNSRSDYQLTSGKGDLTYDDLGSCDPAISVNNSQEQDAINLPCGLGATSFFNDSFTMYYNRSNEKVNWTTDGIAWSTDLDTFKNPPPGQKGHNTTKVAYTNPDFIVWMRASTFPTLRKLYRVIHDPLPPGNYTVKFSNSFLVDKFGGEKYFLLMTTEWIGGKNLALGIGFVVVGGLSFIFSLFVFMTHIYRNSKYHS
eukprot:TRINITY_DN8532_c0_g1_i1.p1 TRINITY_DN8532_c0_g1~~TRINITY_DN8532_c0_g1_i1.p1  ORF type:complete len:334 (-),score=66.14 TRINITY_DN8532_c0_g1_i1:28-981(-)